MQKEKMRHIKYNSNKCLESEEKKKLFLKLDIEESSDECDIHFEIGSDVDYNESDVDSNF